MKKIFAIFCALVLLPSFNVNAWVGGPFSNNNYFGENGDDGVYEASASGINGIGLFRFAVGNNFSGTTDLTTQATTNVITQGGAVVAVLPVFPINSGNLTFGGFGADSNIWFLRGVSYKGETTGTVNSVRGVVAAVGTARSSTGPTGLDTPDIVNSGFRGKLVKTGRTLPVASFRGTGRGRIIPSNGDDSKDFRFTVFGTRVSNQILFGT